MKRALLSCMVLLVLISCRWQDNIIEQSKPDLKIDNSYFSSEGCFNELSCSPQGFQQPDPPITMIQKPSDLLGGLTPAYPLAVGSTVLYRDEEEIPAVFINRCMRSQYIRYLVRVENETILVDSVESLAHLYAPIDSSEEALSYAIATTGYSALFDIDAIKKPRFHTNPVEETFVQEIEDGYVVHLFNTYLCGCGPHITQSVDVTVYKDGVIQLAEPEDAFSDPQYDDLCVD